ncbi:MAG TPA: hypothetical protein VMW72_01830 [Sedimentisphaerales bacterium]|nr:hypothetical protein [Sedimentisphaerales bacterium]
MNTLPNQSQTSKSNHSIIEVLEFCKAQNLPARVVGKWVWIKFESKPSAEIRQALKDFGFRWSPRRGQWSHSCGYSSRPARSYRPWDKYRTISLDEACQSVGLGVTL